MAPNHPKVNSYLITVFNDLIQNYDLDGLANKTVFPTASNYSYNFQWNFGGYTKFSISSAQSDANGYGNFEHAPPSGYYAICTKNLAEYGG